MQTLFFISLVFIVARYIINLFRNEKDVKTDVCMQTKYEKYKDVKYYSCGVELNQPFHLEYRFILDNIEREKEYEMKFQEILNTFPNEPIFEVEVKYPLHRKYFYNYNHVLLANSFLQEQKNYLENLN